MRMLKNYFLLGLLASILFSGCEKKERKVKPEAEFVEVLYFTSLGFIDTLRERNAEMYFEDIDGDGDIDIIAKDSTGKILTVYDNKTPLKFDIHKDKNISKLVMSLRADGYDIIPYLQDSRFRYHKDIAKLLGRGKKRKPISQWELDRKRKAWLKEYMAENSDRAINYMFKHEMLLNRIWLEYGVEPWSNTSFFSRETKCGVWLGDRKIFNTLISVFKDFPEYRYRRHFNAFVQLKSLLKKAEMDGKDIFDYEGSFMGAWGLGQFLMNNIHRFGVDYDKDGIIDLTKPVDAFASTANYLRHFGWKDNKNSAIRAYNRGRYYKMCINEMANFLKGEYFKRKGWAKKYGMKDFPMVSVLADKTNYPLGKITKKYSYFPKKEIKNIPYLGKKNKEQKQRGLFKPNSFQIPWNSCFNMMQFINR